MSSDQLDYILSPQAVRERSHKFLDAAKAGELRHWVFHENLVAKAVELVAKETTENYPDGHIPYHSRWRHFPEDRIAKLAKATHGMPADDVLSSMTGLVIVSVLLDAGAGMQWRYKDPTSGNSVGRSEGLALASCDWFLSGGLATDGTTARADCDRLRELQLADLQKAFQVTEQNPLVGLEGRLELLHNLGACIANRPQDFGGMQRLGGFAEYATRKERSAPQILQSVLLTFGDIWPGRHTLEGQNLGDVWKHPLMDKEAICPGLVPFHKLSQWLTYSLVETCERAGMTISDVSALTGLPEYRNGGLFFDTGVLALRNPEDAQKTWHPSDPLIVEWRALTVALLDVVADEIRKARQETAQSLPLAKILQGGTWSAGRKLAALNRPDGGSPLKLKSDGTVF